MVVTNMSYACDNLEYYPTELTKKLPKFSAKTKIVTKVEKRNDVRQQ